MSIVRDLGDIAQLYHKGAQRESALWWGRILAILIIISTEAVIQQTSLNQHLIDEGEVVSESHELKPASANPNIEVLKVAIINQ